MSGTKFSETRTMPFGKKGDVPVVGVYEPGSNVVPAVWTGSTWTYLTSSYDVGDGLR